MWTDKYLEDEDDVIFPRFYGDIPILIDNEIIKPVDASSPLDLYHWTKSKTSLAEYFKWIGRNETNVRGGFWRPVEKMFLIKGKPIKKGTLSRLASNNANPLKPDESSDFRMIMEIVQQYRGKNEKQQKTFCTIKDIIRETDEFPETMQEALEKIKSLLS